MQLTKGLATSVKNLFTRHHAPLTPAVRVPCTELGDDCFAGLNDLQREALTTYAAPQLFAVVTWGCAASHWVSLTLNTHPDIFCLHGGNGILKFFGQSPVLDGLEYMQLVWALGRGGKVMGDVMGVSRHHVPKLRQLFAKNFNAVVVVRDPIPRLVSQLALFNNFSHLRGGLWPGMSYIDSVLESHGIALPTPDVNEQHRLFAHGVNMLNAITEEKDVGTVYRCEDLTTNAPRFRLFVEELTGGEVPIDEAWVRKSVSRPKTNSHKDKGAEVKFNDWQLDVIRKVVKPEAWRLYEGLGYARPAFME